MRGTLTDRMLLDLFFGAKKPKDIDAAFDAVSAFVRQSEDVAKETTKTAPPYSYAADAAAIISAFQREYGIDLTTEKMHWWRFSALADGLLTDSFEDRVHYRVADIGKIKDKDIRRRYQSGKRRYALDMNGEPVKQPENLNAYNQQLLNFAKGGG